MSEIGGSSVTQRGRIRMMKWNNMSIHVIDTPGLLDTETDEDKVLVEIIKSCGMVSSGPHVILYVMTIRSRFTDEDEKVVNEFINLFAGNPYKHMIICFTDKDLLDRKKKNTVEYLRDIPKPFKNFLEKCGNRTVFFNNVSGKTESQWIQLYSVIETMLTKNNDSFYSNEILREVENALYKKMKEERDPSMAKRWLYKTKRNIENDGSIVSYLKTTLMGAGSGGILSGLTVLSVGIIAGEPLAVAFAAAKTATAIGGLVGAPLFIAGKMLLRKCRKQCSIS